jgi:hypothetical protein
MHDHELIKLHCLFFSLRTSRRCLRLHHCLVVPSIFLSVFPSIKCLKLLLHGKLLSDIQTYGPNIIKETTKIIMKILDLKYGDVYKWVVWLPPLLRQISLHNTIPCNQNTTTFLVLIAVSLRPTPCTLNVSTENRKCNA